MYSDPTIMTASDLRVLPYRETVNNIYKRIRAEALKGLTFADFHIERHQKPEYILRELARLFPDTEFTSRGEDNYMQPVWRASWKWVPKA